MVLKEYYLRKGITNTKSERQLLNQAPLVFRSVAMLLSTKSKTHLDFPSSDWL